MWEYLLRLVRDHFFIPLYFIAWLISVFRYKRFFDTPLKYLPILIIYTFFTELLGHLIKYHDDFQFFSDERYSWHNVVIYNVYQLIFFLYFFEVYRRVSQVARVKKWISYGSVICVVLYFANAILVNPLHKQMAFAHIGGSLIMVGILVQYLREKRVEQPQISLKYNLMFWVSMGLLAFYSIFPLIMVAYQLDLGIGIHLYLRPVLLCLIVLMYLCIIIGLLVGKRKAFR